jgi:predicted RNA-binding Zn ribbon-like protein
MKIRDPLEDQLHLDEAFLCLDFTNTVNWHASTNPEESLTAYSDLVEWGLNEGLLSRDEAQVLIDRARQAPEEAEHSLQVARDLREVLYRIFSALHLSEDPKAEDLAAFNQALSTAMAHSELIPMGKSFAWVYMHDPDDLLWILGPIVRSAADLLASQDLHRIGQCADDRGCGWLFYDTSKNHSRRWCSMESCGNRAKAQRHYHRVN